VSENWDEVGQALRRRRRERGLRQRELAALSGVSEAIIREIEQNTVTRRRNPRTLESLSEALGWPRRHLHDILNGRSSERPEASLESRVETLEQYYGKIEVLEQRLNTAIDLMHSIDSKVDVMLNIGHDRPEQQADT
jgi:transcriptional regulator with XRE-family HTH domain